MKLLQKFGNVVQIAVALAKSEKRLDNIEARLGALEDYAFGESDIDYEYAAGLRELGRQHAVVVPESPEGED